MAQARKAIPRRQSQSYTNTCFIYKFTYIVGLQATIKVSNWKINIHIHTYSEGNQNHYLSFFFITKVFYINYFLRFWCKMCTQFFFLFRQTLPLILYISLIQKHTFYLKKLPILLIYWLIQRVIKLIDIGSLVWLIYQF